MIEFKEESHEVVSDGDGDSDHSRHKGTSDLVTTVTVSGQGSASGRDSTTSSGSDRGSTTTSGVQGGVLHRAEDQDGCFSRALLRDRDELSSAGSNQSQSTEDKEERRGKSHSFLACPP